MADYDVWEWQQNLAKTLPGGGGRIRCLTNSGGSCRVFAVTILWRGRSKIPGAGATGNSACLNLAEDANDTRLNCYAVEVRP
jgi:type IV pilus assembly protein PilV